MTEEKRGRSVNDFLGEMRTAVNSIEPGEKRDAGREAVVLCEKLTDLLDQAPLINVYMALPILAQAVYAVLLQSKGHNDTQVQQGWLEAVHDSLHASLDILHDETVKQTTEQVLENLKDEGWN